jgi:hypothetical protein
MMNFEIENCYDNGLLRRYLDEALTGPARQAITHHLVECPTCRARLEECRTQLTRVSTILAGVIEETSPGEAETSAALARFRNRQSQATGSLKADQRPETNRVLPQPRIGKTSRGLKFSFGFAGRLPRPLLAGLAGLLLVFGLLSVPGVSTAAEQLLQIFRVRNSVFVPVDQDRVQELIKTGLLRQKIFARLPEISGATTPPRPVTSLKEVEPVVGFLPDTPTSLPGPLTGQEFLLRSPISVQFQLNLPALRQWLAQLKVTNLELPEELGTNPVKAEMPAFVEQHYRGKDYQLTLYQSSSPQLTLPGKVDLARLSQVALRLLGMNEEQAEALSRQVDLRSALIFPFPTQVNNFRQVTVNSNPALLLDASTDKVYRYALYWQQGERFYVLMGEGKLNEVDLVATAASLRPAKTS